MPCNYLRRKISLYIHMTHYGSHAAYSWEISELLLEFFKTNCGEIMVQFTHFLAKESSVVMNCLQSTPQKKIEQCQELWAC